jgi:hypothetical protein
LTILILATLLGPIGLVVRADSSAAGVTYNYLLCNRTEDNLHNFTIGALPDTCPELQELPVGWSELVMCPKSIVAAKPWRGCVTLEEECAGYFLAFDYLARYEGIAPGDSLAFSVAVNREDSAFERATFKIFSDERAYEGRTRK